MRLVIDLQAAQGGSRLRGIGRYSRDLALAMARVSRSHEIILLLNARFPDEAAELRDEFDGLASIRLFHPPGAIAGADGSASDRRAAAERIRAAVIADLAPDLLHVGSIFEGAYDDLSTSWPTTLCPPPTAITLYDLIPLIRRTEFLEGHWKTRGISGWYLARLQQMRYSDALLAISGSSRNEAISQLGFPQDRVFDIGTGIDLRFRPTPLNGRERAALLARYGISKEFALTIGTGDPHDTRKNEEGLIAAWGRLPESLRTQHHLVVVGQRDRAALMDAVTVAGLTLADVKLIPYVADTDLAPLYTACKLFIFPSLHEGFGLPAAEAMACGAPVIASGTSSLPEVVGRTDALFDPHDPQAIANAIHYALDNDGFRNELSAHGQKRRAAFEWDMVARRAWDGLEATLAFALNRRHCGARTRRTLLLPGLSPMEAANGGFVAAVGALAGEYALTVAGDFLASLPEIAAAAAIVPSDALAARPSEEIAAEIALSQEAITALAGTLPVPGLLSLRASLAITAEKPSDDVGRALHAAGGWPATVVPPDSRVPMLLAHPALKRPAILATAHRGIASQLEHAGLPIPIALPPLMPEPNLRPKARDLLGLRESDTFVLCIDRHGDASLRQNLLDAWDDVSENAFGSETVLAFASCSSAGANDPLADEGAGRLPARVFRTIPGGITTAETLSAADAVLLIGNSNDAEWPWLRAAALSDGPVPLVANKAANVEFAEIFSEDADRETLGLVLRSLAVRLANLKALGSDAASAARIAVRARRIGRAWRQAMGQLTANPNPTAPSVVQAIATEYPGARQAEIATGIARSLPPCRPPRLWIDVSQFARQDARTGIQRVVREIARHLLLDARPPLADLVRLEGGRLRYAGTVAAILTGIHDPGLEGVPIDAAPGDTVLLLDPNPFATDTELSALRDLGVGGVQVVVCVYDLLPMRRPQWFPDGAADFVRRWYDTAFSIADRAICISRATADDVLSYLAEGGTGRRRRLPVSWFHLAPNFKSSEFAPPEEIKSLARPLVLTVGTIEPRKGYRQALQAMEQLWAERRDVSLLVVGKNGWGMDGFVNLLSVHPEAGRRLLWLSQVDDDRLAGLYRAADVLLMASEGEGFGLPIVEAAAVGTPVVARDIAVFREIAGDQAIYFEGKEASALAAALRSWLDHRILGDAATNPEQIPIRTWAETARQARDAALGQRPYRTHTPNALR